MRTLLLAFVAINLLAPMSLEALAKEKGGSSSRSAGETTANSNERAAQTPKVPRPVFRNATDNSAGSQSKKN